MIISTRFIIIKKNKEMKKVKTYRILLVLSFILMSIPEVIISAPSFGKYGINIGFGVSGRHCTGRGICLITIPDDRFPSDLCTLSLEKDLVILGVPFEKAKKNPEAFYGEFFIVEESYALPPELNKLLGLDKDLILPKGEYQITQTKLGYQIEIKVEY